MKALGFVAYSGAGKTTLLERIIAELRARGQTVSSVKHAHHDVDIDIPGKDSWRHRQAGAQEVLLVCDRRMALVREFGETRDLDVHAMLAELDPRVDWVLVEGFKQGDLPKIELWRQPEPDSKARALRFPQDPQVLALATDDPAALPQQPPARVALLDLNQPTAIVDWMLAHAGRLEYRAAAQESTACSPRL
ncbi:molybdopterin-guanine dinucleotide biosynthesis protein B [Comamonas sp. UBA7528]|uniref:molybdopterin-guanine dinucleotide biosynthesis protein B n=1 Tax=Comamonas sp. UBA7528 TaxID=1946391 RepID=UPI001B797CC0|nr:molybdopterin-guanine dinucleotide biosynthesis protein B [Comamonas sp. UBA7528]MBP7354297.1 molybdopterin-guanine dinucleotide biosynthesis protein B [Comamonas sp.]